MNKPNGFDEVNAGDFIPPMLGGHTCEIKQVKETTSSTGKPMVMVYFDFDQKDDQPGYFAEQFRSDIRPDKKWPYAGTKWILTEDADGKCSRNFKKFINAVEKSNGMTVSWGKGFEAQFKGKRIGAVFGEVESEYNGKVSKKHEPRWWCEYDKAAAAEIPAPQLLDSKPANNGGVADFINVPAGTDEDLPF